MTAIVGVLNKQAIAVAADSAVTIGSGVKVYDKANKIFTLSKRHPVGIAIYSNASFNSCVPWEIIIKMFRREIGDEELDSVKEYADKFLAYLEQFKQKKTTVEELNFFTSGEISRLWSFDVLKQMPNSDPEHGLNKADVAELQKFLTDVNGNIASKPVLADLSKIDKAAFIQCYSQAFSQIKKEIGDAGGDESLYNLVVDTFFNLFTKATDIREKRSEFAGISFFGYGKEDIYPSLYHIHIYNCINGLLFYREIEYDRVENAGHTAYICPMAQKDEMLTYITGINPEIENTLISGTEAIMKQLIIQLASAIRPHNKLIAENISKFDVKPLIDQHYRDIQSFKQNKNIQPLINIVSTMAKEDLAELAENLIYMTSLKRHITPNLESVGGPVDVAVVSKGDGFIWMKRKHYFDPKLNKCFFDNYYETNNK
ncbi:MAG: hypothetical protein KBT08_09025 [Bacteroidales bacterium]|nr:hypothetical protein [Candidatus Cryptobacteroides onthequi]